MSSILGIIENRVTLPPAIIQPHQHAWLQRSMISLSPTPGWPAPRTNICRHAYETTPSMRPIRPDFLACSRGAPVGHEPRGGLPSELGIRRINVSEPPTEAKKKIGGGLRFIYLCNYIAFLFTFE